MTISMQSPVQFSGKFLLRGTPEEVAAAGGKISEKANGTQAFWWPHQQWQVDSVTGETTRTVQDGKNTATGNPVKTVEIKEVWTGSDAERHQKGEAVANKLPGLIERMGQNAAQTLIDFIAACKPEDLDPAHGQNSAQGNRFTALVQDSIFWNREADAVRFSVQNKLGMYAPGNMHDDPERPTFEATDLVKLLDEDRFDLETAREKPAAPVVDTGKGTPEADDTANGTKKEKKS